MGPRFRMGRRRGLLVGAAVGATVANSRARSQANQQADQAPVEEAQAPNDTNQQFAELEKLGQLKDQGILTQEEFDVKKAQILGL